MNLFKTISNRCRNIFWACTQQVFIRLAMSVELEMLTSFNITRRCLFFMAGAIHEEKNLVKNNSAQMFLGIRNAGWELSVFLFRVVKEASHSNKNASYCRWLGESLL